MVKILWMHIQLSGFYYMCLNFIVCVWTRQRTIWILLYVWTRQRTIWILLYVSQMCCVWNQNLLKSEIEDSVFVIVSNERHAPRKSQRRQSRFYNLDASLLLCSFHWCIECVSPRTYNGGPTFQVAGVSKGSTLSSVDIETKSRASVSSIHLQLLVAWINFYWILLLLRYLVKQKKTYFPRITTESFAT